MYNKDYKTACFPIQARALNIHYPKNYMHNVRVYRDGNIRNTDTSRDVQANGVYQLMPTYTRRTRTRLVGQRRHFNEILKDVCKNHCQFEIQVKPLSLYIIRYMKEPMEKKSKWYSTHRLFPDFVTQKTCIL